jgi:hypothetical protein
MCCVVGLFASAGTALAQPAGVPGGASDDPVAAFEAGRKLLEGHHPAEACLKFSRALELEPGNVGVMLNLGLCNEQLDKLATALTWFRRARARASELKLTESVRAAIEKTAALSRKVPAVRLALSPPSAAARVTLDGAVVENPDLERVELDAGHHVFAVTAPGGAASRQDVDVIDGATAAVELVVPAARQSGTPPAGPDTAAGRAVGTQRRRAYIAGAIGGGLVVGSVALGLAGRSAAHSTDHPDVQQRWKIAVRYGGTSMFMLGSAALGWAAWSYLHAPSERADRTVIVPVVPVVGDRSIGLGVQGAF